MARRFFVTLEHVAPTDRVITMAVGDRLALPRHGRITCGRVGGVELQCVGQGQGGRRCFGLDVDGDRVVILHYRHDFPIYVRGKPTRDNAELAPGDTFGPSPGIRFVLGAEDDVPVLFDARRVGRWFCASPRGAHNVMSGIDLTDPARAIVDVVFVEPDADLWGVASTTGARVDVLHPSWPACIERLLDVHGGVRVGERTAGVSLARIVERAKAMGATVDAEMAAWLAESVGRALASCAFLSGHFDDVVSVRFDDGQPILEPSALTLFADPARDGATPAWEMASFLRELDAAATTPRLARAAAVALDTNTPARRADFAELLDALAEARREPGAAMRAAWHGLVHHLFPDDVAADRAVVEALQMLDDATARALLTET